MAGFAAPHRYAAGQVWEYRTRPGDEASRLKIQRIEPFGDSEVFHISVVGVRLPGVEWGVVQHLPVSRETLDKSVVRMSSGTLEFPDPSEGIEIWRRDNGGVFTIPVSEIIQIVADLAPPPPGTANNCRA